jgi:TonB family protein
MNLGHATAAPLGRRAMDAATIGLAALQQRRALYGNNRARLSRSASAASILFVLLFAAAWVIVPIFRPRTVIVELPDRTVTILPEQIEPPPVREAAEALEQVSVRQIADPILPDHLSLPPPRTRPDPEIPDNDASRMGRERAQKVTAELASSAGALDRALRDLSASLKGAQGSYEASTRVRARTVRGGRGDGQLPSAGAGAAAAGRADLAGTRVEGDRVAIGALAPAASSGAASAADDAGASATAPGVHRTNASLLAVIRRYAAGIQYCYDSELKHDPALRGKLVVALTVAASGAVTDVRVVQNTTGSASLAACAVGQIRDWRFPAIPAGVTTFQTPFVFTPPN